MADGVDKDPLFIAQLKGLTLREFNVLRLLCEGLSSQEIALGLKIGKRTVEVDRGRLRMKADCRTSCQLGVWAVTCGLVRHEPAGKGRAPL